MDVFTHRDLLCACSGPDIVPPPENRTAWPCPHGVTATQPAQHLYLCIDSVNTDLCVEYVYF